jgi:recombination protein RecT
MESPAQVPAVINPKKQLRDNLQSENFKLAISELKSKYITADRMVRIALNAINRTPDLAECTQPSFFSALMRLSEVGLEPDGYHAHLIPFNKKVKNPRPGQPQYIKEVQLIIDYKGLVTIVRRNPAIAVVKGAIVYDHDKFIYREGSDRYFEHEPAYVEGDEIKGAYSFVKFAAINDWEMSYMPIWEIEGIRKRSKAADFGPWKTDYEQMCIKTALRRHAKMLPLTADEQRATLMDDDTIEISETGRRSLPQRTAEFRKARNDEPDLGDDNGHFSEPTPPDEPSAPASAPEPDPVEEQKKVGEEFSKSFEKLQKLMEVKKVTDAEILFILGDFQKDVGEGIESIKDLPYATVKDAIKNWGTYEFEVIKLRKAANETK